jgi:hypothetical protein
MNVTLELINEKLPELSVNELLALQEGLTAQLRHKLETGDQTAQTNQPTILELIPGAFRLTQIDVDKIMLDIVSPEKLAKIRNHPSVPFSLPAMSKSLADYVSEDREDLPLPQLLIENKNANG